MNAWVVSAIVAAAALGLAAGGMAAAGTMGHGPMSGWMDGMHAAGMTGGHHGGMMHRGSAAGTVGNGTLVVMDASQFHPTTLHVRVGDTVTWRNDDRVAHTVTSDVGDELRSPLLQPGERWTHTFTQPGTYDYHCVPHSAEDDGAYAGMTGRVVVAPA